MASAVIAVERRAPLQGQMSASAEYTLFFFAGDFSRQERSASLASSSRQPLQLRAAETKKAGHPGLRLHRGERLGRLDIARLLLAAIAVRDFERHLLAVFQRLKPGHVDSREMREKIFSAVVGCNKAEAFCFVEPFNCTGRHLCRSMKLKWAEAREPSRISQL